MDSLSFSVLDGKKKRNANSMNYILHGVFDPWLRYVTNDGIWFDELGIYKVAICLFAHHKSHENHSARVLQMDFSHCILSIVGS